MFKSFIEIAIREAKLAKELGEVPIGAVIVNSKKEIVALGRNMTRTLKDPTAHAEIIAIKQACKLLRSNNLSDCSIYVTLEPCSMCASAISQARLKNLFYGASDPKSGGVEAGSKIFSHEQTHHKTNVFCGFHEEEISKLMREFFLSLRKKTRN